MDDSSNINSTSQQSQRRRRKQISFYILIRVFAMLIIINIIGGSSVYGCLVPITALVGLYTAAEGAELYFTSPERVIRSELIDQELEWLFGKDKIKSITPLEYLFAQERIRRRRAARWRFVLLSIPFWPVIALLLFIAFIFSGFGDLIWGVLLFLLLVLLVMFVRAFPTSGMLARQEHDALGDLTLDIYAQYGSKMKSNVWYKLSYDGELIEISETEALQGNASDFIISASMDVDKLT